MKSLKKSHKNKFKTSGPAWNEKYELPNGSYSVSDIQDCFEYIIKKHETIGDPPIRIYVNKIENRVQIKIGYLELLTPKTMKLLCSAKIKITKDENGGNASFRNH